MQFDAATLRLIDSAYEVDIETARPDGCARQTTIWAVVENGDVYVRSWKGDRGYWYQAALDRPEDVRLIIDGVAVPVRAVWTRDPESIEDCSRGLAKKYRASSSLPSMLRRNVLATTIRLEPR